MCIPAVLCRVAHEHRMLIEPRPSQLDANPLGRQLTRARILFPLPGKLKHDSLPPGSSVSHPRLVMKGEMEALYRDRVRMQEQSLLREQSQSRSLSSRSEERRVGK